MSAMTAIAEIAHKPRSLSCSVRSDRTKGMSISGRSSAKTKVVASASTATTAAAAKVIRASPLASVSIPPSRLPTKVPAGEATASQPTALAVLVLLK